MMFRFLPVLLLLAGCAGGAPGPQSCLLVREAELPVTFDGNLPVVEVMLNGTKVKLVFDTGSQGTIVFESAFARLGLATDPIARSVITGVGGYSSHNNALVDLQVGSVSRRNLSIGVVAMTPLLGGRVDGLLGNDLLERFDLDLDMPHKRIALYRQRNCPHGRPDWPQVAEELPHAAQGRALPPTMIELSLDGVAQNALVDSGASVTSIDRSIALASGATTDALAADVAGSGQGITPAATAFVGHRFGTIKVGTESIAKPRFVVTATEHLIGDRNFGMLLGEDYLRHHRLWIAYSDYKVFVARPTN